MFISISLIKEFFPLAGHKVYFITLCGSNKSIFWPSRRKKIVCDTEKTFTLLVSLLPSLCSGIKFHTRNSILHNKGRKLRFLHAVQGSQIFAHVVYTIFLATRSKVQKQLHVSIGIYWCLPRHLRHERSECCWSGGRHQMICHSFFYFYFCYTSVTTITSISSFLQHVILKLP